ncbi:MAG: tyrosine-type recombinase/integrase [Gemmataceae bacterium]
MSRPSAPWYRSAKNAWYVTINGRKIALNVRGRANRTDAVKAWHKLLGADGPTDPHINVADVLAAFQSDTQTRVAPITLAFYRRFLKPFVEVFGSVAACQLTTANVEAWARRPTWSNSTRNNALGTIATAFNWAADRARLLPVNPLRGIRLPPKESAGASAAVTSEQFAELMRHTARDAGFNAFLRFLWLTGCRPMEGASLTFAMVRSDSSCIVLRRHKTAHRGHGRTIYLPQEGMELVEQQRRIHGEGFIFRNQRQQPFQRMSIVKRLWRLKKATGLHVRAYGFRHSFATRALAAGVPDTHVAELLGHRGTAMLHRHYSHLTARADVLRGALERVR